MQLYLQTTVLCFYFINDSGKMDYRIASAEKGTAIVDYDKPEFSVDLKTTGKDISKFKFDANSMGYDIQARLTNGINGKPFVFVVVQTVAPYDIAVFTTSDFFLNRGEGKIQEALANYENYENEFSQQILYGEL